MPNYDTLPDFIHDFAHGQYMHHFRLRRRCRDSVAGSSVMKGLSSNVRKVQEYLIPTDRHLKHPNEFKRYCEMAVYPGYSGAAALIAGGMIGVGEPDIRVPEVLRSFSQYATPYKDGLKALQRRINRRQMIDGQCGQLLEVNSDRRQKAGEPVFFINSYNADAILRTAFEFRDGESFARFILLDESGCEFNFIKKIDELKLRLRVLGIDEKGRYYQAAITPDQWEKFDILKPRGAIDPDNPRFGEAIYPTVRGALFERIPFTWVNVTTLSGASAETPMISDIADLDIAIFNSDAAYRQTLWFTSQPIFTVIGGDGKEIQGLTYGAGVVHFLAKDYQEQFTEFTGAGAEAQRKGLNDLHERAAGKSMSLFAGVAGNQSGEALKIIQGSQVAPLVQLVETSGEAITELLRYAGRWMGMSREEAAEEIAYTPSRGFARLNLTTQDIMSLINAKITAPDMIPLLWQEIRAKMVESGIAEQEITDFDEFMAEVQRENAAIVTEDQG